MADKIRKHIIFHGQVQGVGFRWHATNFANVNSLTGWVQNLPDGTVEMEVQGTEEKISALIGYMGQRNYVVIERLEMESLPVNDKEWSFHERGW